MTLKDLFDKDCKNGPVVSTPCAILIKFSRSIFSIGNNFFLCEKNTED